jgi:hypothetical protein
MAYQGEILAVRTVELAYLVSLLGGGALFGVPDPFYGWLASEIEEACARISRDLEDREWISPGPEGMVVDEGIASLIRPYAFAETILACSRTLPGQEAVACNLHIQGEVGIEQRVRLIPEPICTLAALEKNKAFHWLAGALGLEKQAVPQAPAGWLPEQALVRARAAAAFSQEESRTALEEAGLPKETAGCVAACLAPGGGYGTLVAHALREGGWVTETLGLLEGEGGLWLIRPGRGAPGSWVELIPAGAEGALREVRGVVERLLPSPAGAV